MIVLTPAELQDFKKIVLPAIYRASPGTILQFRNFFAPLSRSASPRISRYIFECLQQRVPPLYGTVRLRGTRMRDGLIKL